MATRKASVDPIKYTNENGDGSQSANPIDAHVGSRIRSRRTALGYSAKRLGEALGVTVGQLTKWESGAERVGADRLQDLSEILQQPPSAFFENYQFDATNLN